MLEVLLNFSSLFWHGALFWHRIFYIPINQSNTENRYFFSDVYFSDFTLNSLINNNKSGISPFARPNRFDVVFE